MKVYNNLICLMIALAITFQSYAHQTQGTTVRKDGCNVSLILQIALETDSVADIARMQSTLNGCFSLRCDLPCVDGSKGRCFVISSVVVVNWNNLSEADKPKFHHVRMLPGNGVSSVDRLIAPNSGKSSSGTWYRNTYSPKVYCHEAMHLCGLDDHYRDCRADRLALRVDNCKDGDTCTAEQKRLGETPPCKGFENDVMGNDVTKPFDCNQDIMEVIRFLNNADFACSDSCCAEEHRTQTNKPKHPQIGLQFDGGLGYYPMRNETLKDDKLNMLGHNFSIGLFTAYPLCAHFLFLAYAGLNCAGMSDSRTTTQTNYLYTEHFSYRFSQVSLGANVQYPISDVLKVYGGIETGLIYSAKSRANGSTTFNNMTTPFGSDQYSKITNKRKLQLGVKLGAIHPMKIRDIAFSPLMNVYFPLTNEIAFTGLRNKYYRCNVGVQIPLARQLMWWK